MTKLLLISPLPRICIISALRLTQVVDFHGTDSSNIFSLIGLGNTEVWKIATENEEITHSFFLYKCLMYFLETISEFDRRKIVLRSSNENPDIFIYILNALVIDCRGKDTRRSETTVSQCEHFFTSIGGMKELPIVFIESCCFRTVEILASSMNELSIDGSKENLKTLNEVVVLAWLLEKLDEVEVLPLTEDVSDNVEPTSIKIDDTLWYVLGGDTSVRTRVRVVKIYSDDYPNLYFDIEIDGKSKQVRQTVSSRLRSKQCSPQDQGTYLQKGSTPTDRIQFKKKIERDIVLQLVKPYVLKTSPTNNYVLREAAAELLSIVIGYYRLKHASEVATIANQIVKNFERQISFTSEDLDHNKTAIFSMKCLALILGYGGRFTPHQSLNCTILKFDCSALMGRVFDFFERTQPLHQMQTHIYIDFYLTTLELLTVCVTHINVDDTSRSWNMLKSITVYLMNNTIDSADHLLQSQLAYDALSSASSTKDMLNLQRITMSNMLGMFIAGTEDSISCNQSHDFFIRNLRVGKDIFEYGAKTNIEALYSLLMSPEKQYCAFQVLSLFAKKGEKVYDKDEVHLERCVSEQLDSWTSKLEEDEAFELEKDILACAELLPSRLMSDIITWSDNYCEHKTVVYAKVFAWLLLLDFLDGASSLDMRNRSYIISYVEKSGVIATIFKMVLREANLDNRNNDGWSTCTSPGNNNICSLSDISTLAVFRTVESMPTLCKMWWRDYCPRSLQPNMTNFVQNWIAPETLRREINRISGAENLGELKVSGSCVSREITATYIQDEVSLVKSLQI